MSELKVGDFVSAKYLRYHDPTTGFTIFKDNTVATCISVMGNLKIGQIHNDITTCMQPYTTVYIMEERDSKLVYILYVDTDYLGGMLQVLEWDSEVDDYKEVKSRVFQRLAKGSKLYRDKKNESMVYAKLIEDYSEDIPNHIVTIKGRLNRSLQVVG